MLRNLTPTLKAALGLGGALIAALLLSPASKDDLQSARVEAPKALGRTRTTVKKVVPLVEPPSPATSVQLTNWARTVKKRAAFQPLVTKPKPAAPEVPRLDLPAVPPPLRPRSLDNVPSSPSPPEPPEAPTPDLLYTGWYSVNGKRVALLEDLTVSEYYYVPEGESHGDVTVLEIQPTEVRLRIRGVERRLAKTDEFAATPLNNDAPVTGSNRGRGGSGGFRGGPGGFSFGGRGGPPRGGEDRGRGGN